MADGTAGKRLVAVPPSVGSTPGARIGGTFARAARGPLDYAGSCLLGNRIQTGLEELGADGLRDAYMRGLAEVARVAAVPRRDVERAVDLTAAVALERRLRESHAAAIAAWKMHAGQFGFLDVMTALTVDGRHPDVGLCLERVAKKVMHDRALSEPIEALSVDITAWTKVVDETRLRLEDLGWIASSMRRRAFKRVAVAVAAVAASIAVTIALVTVSIARDEVAARVDGASNCEAETLTDEDLSWANDEQRAAVKTKVDACADERDRRAEARRAEEERLEVNRRRREAILARGRSCAVLASDVEGGRLGDESKATAADSSALLERVAKKSLQPTDVGPMDPKLPCADSEAATKRLEAAYAEALLVDSTLWARRSDPSSYARKIITARKADVPPNVLIGLADNAERTATSGLSGGDATTLDRARRLCAFASDLGVPGQRSCRAVEALGPTVK